MAWKAKFDEERLSQKEVVVKEKRLTGKELFLQNISLNESDLQFITEGINHLDLIQYRKQKDFHYIYPQFFRIHVHFIILRSRGQSGSRRVLI